MANVNFSNVLEPGFKALFVGLTFPLGFLLIEGSIIVRGNKEEVSMKLVGGAQILPSSPSDGVTGYDLLFNRACCLHASRKLHHFQITS